MARGDSFVVETNVHFPVDISQLFDAIQQFPIWPVHLEFIGV